MAENGEPVRQPGSSGLGRIVKYAVLRAITLALMVGVGIFLAIVVVNYGGYIDKMVQASIDESLNMMSRNMPHDMSPEEVKAAYDEARWQMQEAAGLHEPFLLRCVRWWVKAVTLDWGETYFYTTMRGNSVESNSTLVIILQRIPNTLMLAGAANVLLFFASLFLALSISKKHGSWLDRIIITLSPISSVPNWVYGILLTVILAGELHLLPFGGMYDEFPPALPIGYVLIVLKHMILPVLAIFLSTFFQTVYAWRTYFLIHAGEDYVEMARAQGLPERMIERRYLLRPALPYTITSFALMIIGFWQSVFVLELFFRWPGIGQLFITAIRVNDRQVTVGLLVIFAFLLGVSIFLLDFIYALIDPRVRIGGQERARRPARRGMGLAGWIRGLRGGPPSPRTSPSEGEGGGPSLRPSPWRAERGRAFLPSPSEGDLLDSEGTRRGAGGEGGEPGHGRWGKTRRARRGKRPGWLSPTLVDVLRYPSAVLGLAIIACLIGVAIYTVVTVPYQQAVADWRPETAEKYHLPEYAMPAWVNLFRKDPLPVTQILDTHDGTAAKVEAAGANGTNKVTLSFVIDYPYRTLPPDMALYFDATYQVKKPFVTLTWVTPDHRQIDLGSFSVVDRQTYMISQNLPRKLVEAHDVRRQAFMGGQGGYPATEILFANPTGKEIAVLPGTYTLRVDGLTFEAGSTMDGEVVLWGQVYGLAGTDNQRRDLMVALLWGTPVALAFGFLGAIATSLLSMTIAAAGAWFGGWVDEVVQRLTEVNMILPTLPIAIMVFYLYSHSIWAILGVIVLLGVLGSAVKTYRAAFLQMKEAPYIEAAQSYGARDWRIVRHYLVPRIVPLLVPQMVILVPTYVFFEATLAYLGITDPNMPTWGKVVYDALTGGAYEGHYYWVLEPIGLMMVTGLGFAMVGFALDTILNPRLRSR